MTKAIVPDPLPISAVLITCNAAAVLSDCLASVRPLVAEIVLVDSGSQDETLTIASRFGARIITQPWLGYGPQKQLAVDQASHNWVLCLDADERLTPELTQSIRLAWSATEGPSHQAYRMARCNRFMGRWLRHGEGYPDWQLRLFHRQHGHWSSDPVHEQVVTTVAVAALAGDLLHESAECGIEDYLAKQNRYTSLQARQLLQRGVVVHGWQICCSPLLRFIKFYLLRRGFLDGVPGLVHIAIGCSNSLVKYAKLWLLQRDQTDEHKEPESAAVRR
ncbi:MAG: glycosyltransferase family 2 protein [Magnetococcales bacterium]|nr:glycosyltransferase family 2 protein [Magnetococcales bacterium]